MSVTRLSEVCEEIVDCLHETAPTQENGIPSIRTSNIENGRLDLANADRVSEETYQKWTQRSEPQPGDIILAREAPVGEVGMVPQDTRVCLGQRTVQLRPDRSEVAPRYLLFLLLDQEMQNRMESMAAGSTVAHLNLSDIRELELPELPPLLVQRRIADILGTLDDKIELNRRMNETLEEMAQALYRHWFVDFGPFQDREFKDTEEFGPIPGGWEVGEISDIAKFRNGKRPPTNAEEGPVPVWGANGPTGRTEEAFFEEKVLITGRVGTLGNVFRIESPVWPSDNTITIRPREEHHFEFLYLTLRRIPFESISRGSTQPLLAQKDLKPRTFPKPPVEELQAFHSKVRPMYERIDVNRSENQTLAETRDYLLPKLISGEIEVGAAEEVVETETQQAV